MKESYLGSVRFFRHLIILIILIMLISPWGIIYWQSKRLAKLEDRVYNLEFAAETKNSRHKTKHFSHFEQPKLTKKVAYLTFDDGPSEITDEILDILKEKNIKATFFVTYHGNYSAIKTLRRIVNEGHMVGLHSYTHQYDLIYSSLDAFTKDIKKLNAYIVNSTGYVPLLYRFPGGSNNRKLSRQLFYRIKDELNKRGYIYFDWNVSSADSTPNTYVSVNEIINNCYYGARYQQIAIILMHDTSIKKQNVVLALPTLIDKLKNDGFSFKTLSTDTPQFVFRK